MNLFIIRHAIAEEPDVKRFSEAKRPLTEVGRQKMHQNAQGMRRLGLAIETIFSSPWKRAWDTAEIVREALGVKNEIIAEPLLIPGSSLESLLKKLADRNEKNIALVGHEPILSEWIRQLLDWPSPRFEVKKGGICQLQWNRQWKPGLAAANLELFLKPHHLRQ